VCVSNQFRLVTEDVLYKDQEKSCQVSRQCLSSLVYYLMMVFCLTFVLEPWSWLCYCSMCTCSEFSRTLATQHAWVPWVWCTTIKALYKSPYLLHFTFIKSAQFTALQCEHTSMKNSTLTLQFLNSLLININFQHSLWTSTVRQSCLVLTHCGSW